MSFYICPLDQMVRKVLTTYPHLKRNFSAKRMPIAERAKRHRENFSLKTKDIADLTLDDDLSQAIIFSFYNNTISLDLDDVSMAQAMLCHFLPIFKKTKCFIKIETFNNFSIRLIAIDAKKQRVAILRLMPLKSKNTLYLADIETYQGKGFGAKLLEATYCLAQDLSFSKIDFTVADDPVAQSFYVHMDFGKPTNSGLAGKWELRIIPIASQKLKTQPQFVKL